jgi:hypothetical protein
MTEKPIAPTPEDAIVPVPEEEAAIVPAERMDTEGVGELSREDFKLPIIRIVQSQSRNAPEEAQGKFHNSVTNIVKDYMIVTVLRVGKTRILFPPVFSADSEPLCASDDSKAPRPQFVGNTLLDFPTTHPHFNVPASCDECILKEWGPNHEPPICALSYKYILVDLEDGMPGILSLKRTDVSMGRALNTLLSTPGLKKLRLSSKFTEVGEGQWFAFRYTVMEKMEETDWATAQSMQAIAAQAFVSADMDTEDMTPTGEPSETAVAGTPTDDHGPPPPPEEYDDDIPF